MFETINYNNRLEFTDLAEQIILEKNSKILDLSFYKQKANIKTPINFFKKEDTIKNYKNLIKFENVICRSCVELHTDKCDNCQSLNEFKSIEHDLKKSKNSIGSQNEVLKSILDKPKFNTKIDHSQDSFQLSLLTLIIKEKYSHFPDQDTIKKMIASNQIEISNQSTPFEKQKKIFQSSPSSSLETKELPFYPKSNNDFLYKRKLAILDEAKRNTSKSPVNIQKNSEHYFKNTSDLNEKVFKKNQKIKLKTSPVPETSNHIFNRIEKLDICEKYKRATKFSHDVENLIKKSNELHAKITEYELKTSFEKLRFKEFYRI